MYRPDTPYGAYPKRSPLETKTSKLALALALALAAWHITCTSGSPSAWTWSTTRSECRDTLSICLSRAACSLRFGWCLQAAAAYDAVHVGPAVPGLAHAVGAAINCSTSLA